MKFKFLNLAIALIFTLGLFSSCSNSDDSNDNQNNNNAAEIAQIETAAETGTWRVTSFIDSGQDETNDFNGYDFTFSSNGSLSATNGVNTYNGSWSVTDSSSSSSSSDDDIDFIIMFQVPDDHDFDDLNDDWDVVTHSSSLISLIDISGGNGGTDTLVIQKN